ncbi:unnamed protein product [Acanthoscelides obtectus]|uniref:Uncharacterized protein n=1 Tax=Acanthoscelides obtectus TaxID=200917 RepID=A0A9P0K8U2_ACAOB|nr:unnamed protein product [Acanthoscelides obtectus]CAK1662512.1 hypothetical protein AOBTE_LOCUS23189 [Acanthoscelides obtectus]
MRTCHVKLKRACFKVNLKALYETQAKILTKQQTIIREHTEAGR